MESHSIWSIEGDRVRFTPLQLENIYQHFRWNNDPELNRLDSEVPYEEETFSEFKRRFERMREESSSSRDFEIHQKDGPLIGVAFVTDLSPHNRHGNVGITIGDRDYWGKGYGRESLELLLEYCFEELDLHRVGAEIFEYNEAWRRLVQAAGFQKEGTAREYLYRDEQFWNKESYSLLAREYREQRSEKAPLAVHAD